MKKDLNVSYLSKDNPLKNIREISYRNYSIKIISSKSIDDLIENITEYNTNLVLVDFNFLISGDIELWLQKLKSNFTPIIIVLDKNTKPESISDILEKDIDDYIYAPIDNFELFHKIKIHSRLRNKKDTIEELKKGLVTLEKKSSEETINMYNDLQLAYKELELRKKELESLDKAKSDFIRIVSHEIRTPLSGILGFSQLLKTKLPNEYTNYLGSLNESALRLQEFSNKAILISKLKTNSYKIENEPHSLLFIINSIIEKLNTKIRTKKIKIRNKVTNRIISTDFNLTEKALSLIIENAIKYTPQKSTIYIEELLTNGKISIMVIDEGGGFKAEVFETLFGLFAHGEKYVDKNTGLGLYMAKLIMNYLGGAVKVSNSKEGGATVRLNFPV